MKANATGMDEVGSLRISRVRHKNRQTLRRRRDLDYNFSSRARNLPASTKQKATMAKSRRNRAKAHRSDPISTNFKPPKPLIDPELAILHTDCILPVLKDLQSIEPNKRTEAAAAVANIIHDPKCRKLLLREQIVHIILTETLTDGGLESKAAGWEILKVLVENEESDLCVHLYRSDVLTAIEFASKQIGETLTASEPHFSKVTKAQQRFVWEITSSLLALLSSLAEAREEISDSITSRSTIASLLFLLVSTSLTPSEIIENTLSTLATLAEDNRKFSQSIVDSQVHGCYGQLLKLKDSGGAPAVLACAVLHKVFASLDWHDQSPGLDGASDAILVPKLVDILERTKLGTGTSNGTHGLEPAETLQLALDILASIGTELKDSFLKGNRDEKEWNGFDDTAMSDDEKEVVGGDESDNDQDMAANGAAPDEMDQDDIDADMEQVTGADHSEVQVSGIEHLPTLRGLIQKAIPQVIRQSQTQPNDDESVAVQMSALSALNNIAWTLSFVDFCHGANAGIFSAWCPAARSIWSKAIRPILASESADLVLGTTVTSLSWAISRSLGGNTPLRDDEHRRFISLYKASDAQHEEESDPFESLSVQCVGVLGQLGRDPSPIELNREIGAFLLSVPANLPTAPPADVVEALNQIMDVYADENSECDKEVFWKDGFLSQLEAVLPMAKMMAKQINKRESEELRIRADEAVLNLGRFIQYKRKRSP